MSILSISCKIGEDALVSIPKKSAKLPPKLFTGKRFIFIASESSRVDERIKIKPKFINDPL